MSELDAARHLAAITREAAGRAYEADAGAAGKLTAWLATILSTLHAGGLLAALQYADRLARPYEAQCSLLAGLIATLCGGVAGVVHFNAMAERWRHEMHMEIEGAKDIGEAVRENQLLASKADVTASVMVLVSILSLALAGAFAI